MSGFYRTSAGGEAISIEFPSVVTVNPDGTQATGGGGGGGGDASATNQTTQIARLDSILLLIGAEDDAAADSDTGTHSLNALHKRELARRNADRTKVSNVISTFGDNSATIAAPAAGNRIVITFLRIQADTVEETDLLFKSGSTVFERLKTSAIGSGVDSEYSFGNETRLGTAEAFVINLSEANAHQVSVRYYVENATTGLPI